MSQHESKMLDSLQDTHVQLQAYLSDWCKKQQRILEAASAGVNADALGAREQDSLQNVKAAWMSLCKVQDDCADMPETSKGQLADAIHQLEIALGPSQPAAYARPLALETQGAGNSGQQADEPVHENGNASTAVDRHIRRKDSMADLRNLQAQKKIAFHRVFLVVHTHTFEFVASLVIMSNAVVMGLEAQHHADNLHGPESEVLNNISLAFTLFYIVEIVFRIGAWGKEFFVGHGVWQWNCFDFLLVLLAVIETVMASFGKRAEQMQQASFLRIARLAKLVKLLRFIRLARSFKELRLILASISGSVHSILWAMLLLSLTMYGFGIAFLRYCSDLLIDRSEIGPELRTLLDERWSTVPKTMLTLFIIAFGGADWWDLIEPLRLSGQVPLWLVFVYLIWFNIVIVNTVASIFLDQAMQNSGNDDDMRIEAQLEDLDQYTHMLEKLFKTLDDSGDGYLSMEEFCRNLEHPGLKAFVAVLDIDVHDAQTFFEILSNDGMVEVDVRTFVVGCIKLKGQARSVDLFTVFHTVQQVYRKVNRIENSGPQLSKQQQLDQFDAVRRHFDKCLQEFTDRFDQAGLQMANSSHAMSEKHEKFRELREVKVTDQAAPARTTEPRRVMVLR